MRPYIPWANPPMHVAFGAATVGALGLLLGDPTLPVAVRFVAEGAAWLMCVRGRGFVAVPALLAALVLPFSGHAQGAGAIFADAVHVLSAAMWVGGILALAALRPPEGWRSPEAALLLERFGRVAVVAFAITALTGFLRATEQLGDVSQLWSTTYGVVLALKLVAIGTLIAISLAWRRGWVPARGEAVIAAAVVLFTAILAAIPPLS